MQRSRLRSLPTNSIFVRLRSVNEAAGIVVFDFLVLDVSRILAMGLRYRFASLRHGGALGAAAPSSSSALSSSMLREP